MLVGGDKCGIVEGHVLRYLPGLPGLAQRLRLKHQLLDLVVHDHQDHRLHDEGPVAAHVHALGGAAADLVDEAAHLVVVFVQEAGRVERQGFYLVAVAARRKFTAEDLSHHGAKENGNTVKENGNTVMKNENTFTCM